MSKAKIQPRVLKGFRDYLPQVTMPRTEMIDVLKQVFLSFGFVPIDTPALEYAEILLGKGSEETDKQLYRFQDNGGRDIALRFDLTVPLARFAAMHINELGTPFKRYHIAPVWRAEKPQRGRFREFIQCDFDIIGTRSVLADAEILLVINSAFQALGVPHQIRLNNRLVLNGFLETLGAQQAGGAVLRAIDKLEKLGREVVMEELRSEAGLSPEQTERVLAFVDLSREEADAARLTAELRRMLSASPGGMEGVSQLEKTAAIAARSGMRAEEFRIDLSIARGLDYYTGSVFETTLPDLPEIGSVCSGGRYDDLASLYTNQELPGVGASVGLDRLLAALEELGKLPAGRSSAQVLISILDEGSAALCFALAQSLRREQLRVETFPQAGKLAAQLKYADRRGIPYLVLAGEREFASGRFSVKEMATGVQTDDLTSAALADYLRARLSAA